LNRKLDIEKIESTLDFKSVNEKLETLSQSGTLRRRKTVSDLLDKIKPSLLIARANKVPFKALAKFLTESGIPVSEPTLRQYIHAQRPSPKRTRKPRQRVASPPPGSESGEPTCESAPHWRSKIPTVR